jgi:U32 family peptidase
MLDAGVSVLKIEGRARSAEYVKTTVQCYREAVEAYFDNSFTPKKKLKTGITRLSIGF